MTQDELIELLADKEHASWARWMSYLFDVCEADSISGGTIIPAELRVRWQRQTETPYADLSEREKQSDRDEVAHILPIIEEYGATIKDHAVKEIMRTKNPAAIAESAFPSMPNPTPEQVEDPTFLAIWNVIKSWDVNVPEHYFGYCGANGSHVMLIFNALNGVTGD